MQIYYVVAYLISVIGHVDLRERESEAVGRAEALADVLNVVASERRNTRGIMQARQC